MSRLLRHPLGAASLLALALFLALAAGRRLNFDEALALRAGWLAVQGIPASPPFYMPTTLALGVLATLIADPGVLMLVCRLLAAGGVAAALLRFSRLASGPASRALTLLLTLSCSVFVAHGLEFRYDWAILVAWLLAAGWLARAGSREAWWLGVAVAWLAAHHLKGVVFGAALTALALAALLRRPEGRRRRAARFALGALAAAAVWIGGSLVAGRGGELAAVYGAFLRLAWEGGIKVWPWSALGEVAGRDLVWWLGAGAATLATLRALRRVAPEERIRDGRFWALPLALAPLAFLFLHPLPWAYLLALPVPFLALPMAESLAAAAARRSPALPALLVAGALALQLALVDSEPTAIYRRSLAAPRAPQTATLRLLRREADPGDRIVDPSGLAYFLAPCTREWYLDTLFERRAEEGRWMSELRSADLGRCRWALNTYRLQMLPEALEETLRGRYRLLAEGGGLALLADDPLLAAGEPAWGLRHNRLESFW